MTRQRKTVSKVLELADFARERMKTEVKKSRESVQYAQDKLACLEKELKEHYKEFNKRQTNGSLGVSEMDLFYAYFEHLGKHIEHQKKCVLVRQADLEAKQKIMNEAYQEHRLMEILHDKIMNREVRAAAQGEQKETDSQFLMRRAER